MRRNPRRPSRSFLVLLTCVLAVPTVACLMGYQQFPADFRAREQVLPLLPYVVAGGILGLAHVFLRPILRFITAPLGCITFGLSGTAIDIALIYLVDHFIDPFHVPGFAYALLTALLINAISAIAGGRR